MCGYRKIEKMDKRCLFSPPRTGTDVFFSLSASRFFSFLEKRFLVFATCSTDASRRNRPSKSLPKKSPPNPKKRGRSRHILLSVVSRSPGKLFKRTLTYRGKRTQRYVKREREREKRRRGAFSPSSCPGCSKNAG